MMVQEKPRYMYAIASLSKEYIYVGLAFDPDLWIAQHQNGKEQTTKPYQPFEVPLVELCSDRPAARTQEKYLKSGAGKEFLKELRASQRKAK